jgi:HNH endonuclease
VTDTTLPAPLVPAEVKPTRVALSKRTRFEVFKRDGFQCQYCGAHPPGVLLHVDHIMPASLGGSGDMDNLITSCEPCNLGKAAIPLSVVPQSLADRAAEVAEREEQLLGYQAIFEAKRQRLEDETWRALEEVLPGRADNATRNEFSTVKRFIEKLGLHVVLEAAEITWAAHGLTHRTHFRYFCGVCWNKVRDTERGQGQSTT